MAAFLILVTISAAVSGDVLAAIVGQADRNMGVVSWFVIVGAFMLGASLREVEARSVRTAVVCSGVAAAGLAVLQRADFGPFDDVAGTGGRVTSTFGSATYLAAFLVLAAPVIALETLDGSRTTRYRRICAVSAVIVVVALALTESRGAWIGAGAAALFVLSRIHRTNLVSTKKRIRVTLSAVAAAALFAASATLRGRLATLLSPNTGTAGGRWVLWRAGFQAVLHRPFLGYGPDLTRTGLPGFLPANFETRYGNTLIPDRSHNAILDVALWVGVPATLVLVVFITKSVRAPRLLPDRRTRANQIGVAAGLIGFAGHLMFNFTQPELDTIAALLLGILVAHPTSVTMRTVRPPTELKPLIGLAFVAATTAVAVWAGGLFLADVYARSAAHAESSGDETGARNGWEKARAFSFDAPAYLEATVRFELRSPNPTLALAFAEQVTGEHSGDPFFAELEPLALVTVSSQTGDIAMAARAEAMYRRLVKKWPGHASYHTGLGIALATRNGLDAAVTELEIARALTPKRVEPVQDLIEVSIRQRHFDVARRYLNDGILLDPSNPIWGRLREQIDVSANAG